MISTNQKPGFLALGQWEALFLQKFMSTFQTEALLTDLWEPRSGGTELELNDIPYTHPILKADLRLRDLSIPQGGGTDQEFIPYTHPILKAEVRLKDLPIPWGGGTELEFIPYTHPILKADVRLEDLSIPWGGGTELEFIP